MTYWSFIVLIVHLWLQVGVVRIRSAPINKIAWVCFTNVAVTAPLVTTGYYSFVEMEPGAWTDLGDLHRHLINTVIVIIDIIMLMYKINIVHFFYLVLYFVLYVCLTYIYWFIDPSKNIIYKQLNYSHTKLFSTFLFLILSISCSFFFHMFHFFLCFFKSNLRRQYNNHAINV